jgi:hypothetical protein
MLVNVLNRVTRDYYENLDPANFPVEAWVHNPSLAAVQGVDRAYWVITGDAVSSMTTPQITALEAVRLPRVKTVKLEVLDDKTSGLIQQGFEFPTASGKIFSLSLESQANIHGIYITRALPEVTYPIRWLTKDDDAYIDLVDAADVEAFFLKALGTIRTIKDAGSALKTSVSTATTVAGVLAVVDSR